MRQRTEAMIPPISAANRTRARRIIYADRMFERLSEATARVLFCTRQEASELGISSITPELLLLGLVREPKGLLSDILASTGLVRDDVRREIMAHTPAREEVGLSREIPFTEAAKRVVISASEESNRTHHAVMHPEHLLLGLLSEQGTLAVSVLEKRGLRFESVRDLVLRMIEPNEGENR